MKKLALITMIFALFTGSAFGQGAATQTGYYLGSSANGVFVIKFACVASAVDGSFPAIAFESQWLDAIKGWHCYRAKTDPGAVAPTANYDIAITESGGDVFGGNLGNRSATATEFAAPYIPGAVASAVGMVTMETTWSLVITNNAVNSATLDLWLFFKRVG